MTTEEAITTLKQCVENNWADEPEATAIRHLLARLQPSEREERLAEFVLLRAGHNPECDAMEELFDHNYASPKPCNCGLDALCKDLKESTDAAIRDAVGVPATEGEISFGEWWQIMLLFAEKGFSASITFDRDYGIDKRTGWTVVVDGIVRAELCESPQDAAEKAMIAVLESDEPCSPPDHRTGTPRATGDDEPPFGEPANEAEEAHAAEALERLRTGQIESPFADSPPVTPPTPAAELPPNDPEICSMCEATAELIEDETPYCRVCHSDVRRGRSLAKLVRISERLELAVEQQEEKSHDD